MANKKIKTVLENVVKNPVSTIENLIMDTEEVELTDNFKGSSSIIHKHMIITFVEDKATINSKVAEDLRTIGFIK